MLKLNKIFTIIIMIFVAVNSYAAAQKKTEFKTGVKTAYSSGISEKNIYYQAFFESTIPANIFTFNPKISGYSEYQISDGYGNYKEISFFQPGLLCSVKILKQLDLSCEYLYSQGETDYIAHELFMGMLFENNFISLDFNYTKNRTEYEFDTLEIKNDKEFFFIQLCYFYNDALDFELGYEKKKTFYNNLDYTYIENLARAGISLSIFTQTIILAGLTYGKDNDDYTIYGLDTGLLFKIKAISFSLLYTGYYYKTSENIISIDSGSGNGGRGQNSNPMLSDSASSENSFYDQRLILKISYSF